MHSVLSKTKYQHLSGTRCAMDVVEIPSHVFEYFAWDADALKVISEHRSTGEALPGDFIHVRSIPFFTRPSVSTFDRVSPFQLTDEHFLYGTTLSGCEEARRSSRRPTAAVRVRADGPRRALDVVGREYVG